MINSYVYIQQCQHVASKCLCFLYFPLNRDNDNLILKSPFDGVDVKIIFSGMKHFES